VEYLRRGFEAAGVRVSEDVVERAVDELDGIIGWLVHFGPTAVDYAKAGKRRLRHQPRLAPSLCGLSSATSPLCGGAGGTWTS